MHRTFKCPKPCERIFKPCGHECPKDCSEPCGLCNTKIDGLVLPCGHTKNQVRCYQAQDVSKIKCGIEVSKAIPGCGHSITVECYKDVASATFKCPEPCDAILSCGHPCRGSCGGCEIPPLEYKVEHRECQKICGRRYGACQHTCEKVCHDGTDCGLCNKPCEVSPFPFVSSSFCLL